jgi:2,3-bisphosphoglycerate-independent phosphoglycerate mutase
MAYPEIKKLSAHLLLEDATAGGITSDEAREFIDAINEQLGSESVQFYPGSAHRHLMVWVGGKSKATCVDPAHGIGKPIDKLLPSGDGADILKNVMEASAILLSTHPLNDPRYDSGAKPVNCVWLWGQGKAVKLPKFTERQALSGAVMAECELHRGVGVTAGLDAPQVEETVGSHEERYATLCRMVLDDASKRDFLYVHVQVGDGSEGGGTVKSIEALDRLLIGPLVERLKKQGNGRVLVVADRVCAPDGTVDATGPIPYVLWDAAAPSSDGTGRRLTESDAVATAVVREGTKLFNRLVANKTA